jgi:hypothetical protein
MKLIKWSFRELHISMVKIEGELYCTSASLCAALGLSKNQLAMVMKNNKGQLNPDRVSNRQSIVEFMRFIRDALGIERVKAATLLWPLREALKVAYLARTDVSWEFINASIDLVQENATQGMVSREEFEALERRLDLHREESERLTRLEAIVLGSQEALQVAASAAGSVLAAQRGTRRVRQVN